MNKPPLDIEAEFDEAWYLHEYPDVAAAVRAGTMHSGLAHFIIHGQKEGRSFRRGFDTRWYAQTYPQVAEETDAADPQALRRHYRRTGRHRGYLSHPQGARSRNPAAPRSSFGGLWIDAANASDLIAGKRDTGLITPAEAALLRAFATAGYVKLPAPAPRKLLGKADRALEAAYAGQYADLLFRCDPVSPSPIRWEPGVTQQPAEALDIHWFSNAIRELMFCQPLTRLLHLLFERPALAMQSIGYYRGSPQPMHQDSAYVATSLPRQFATAWIALEDVTIGAGELDYYTQSHRALPPFSYPGGVGSIAESLRLGIDGLDIAKARNAHLDQIQTEAMRRSLARQSFIAKRGDILLLHPDLAYGANQISEHHTRKSLLAHYCPSEVAPHYFEGGNARIYRQGQGSYFTSGVYDSVAPGEMEGADRSAAKGGVLRRLMKRLVGRDK